MTRVAVLICVGLVGWLVAAPASAGRPTCGVGSSNRLLTTSRVVVWQVGEGERYRMYACWKPSGRRVFVRGPESRLVSAPTFVDATVVRSTLAVVTSEALGTTGDAEFRVFTGDLRTESIRGRLLRRTSSLERLGRAVRKVVLRGDAATAFAIEELPDIPTAAPTEKELLFLPARGRRRIVATGTDIDVASLRFRDDRLEWTQGGARQSVVVGEAK